MTNGVYAVRMIDRHWLAFLSPQSTLRKAYESIEEDKKHEESMESHILRLNMSNL